MFTSSSTVSVFFLLESQLLGSGVQAGATKQTKTRPTTHTEREKIIIEVYGEEKKLLELP